MARGRKWTFEKIMKTRTKNIPADDLYAATYNLTKIANKRIEQVERSGYNIIKNQSKYFISNKTGKFYDVQKGNDSNFYRRRIEQLKSFINSPGNDIKKINKEQRRIKDKYKGEKITKEDYIRYRKQAGKVWAKIDENEKKNGLGSEEIEAIIIKNMKSFKTFKALLKHVEEDIKAEKEYDTLKNELFEKKMRELNGQ